MFALLQKLENNPRFFAVFYGAIGSLLFWLVMEFSGSILLALGDYSWGILTNFIDGRYARASVLEQPNYSIFLLGVVLVIFAIAWAATTDKIKNNITNETDSVTSGPTNNDAENMPNWFPAFFNVLRIVVWGILAYLLLFISGESIILNARADFQQHMRIIAPYINNQEEEEFFSEWSQMESIDDYNNIYVKIIPIAKTNNL